MCNLDELLSFGCLLTNFYRSIVLWQSLPKRSEKSHESVKVFIRAAGGERVEINLYKMASS